MNKIHEYLGVDLGMSKSGVARGNSAAKLAEPVGVVKTSELVESLNKMIEKNSVNGVVLGLPRGLDGQETQQTQWVRSWAGGAKTELNAPLYWQDEALTTQQAASNGSGGDDAEAAAIILQDFLDTPEDEKVIC